jgi:MFS family permease
MFPMIVLVGLVLGAISLINVAEVFFVRETLHASATMYGIVAAAWTGAMMIGGWLVSRRATDDSGYAALLAASFAIASVAIAVAGVVPTAGWLIPLMIVGGIGNGMTTSLSGVLIARRAPAPVRGRVFARFGAVVNAACMIGYVLGGVLVGPVHIRVLIVGCGAAGLVVTIACAVPMLRAGRRERARTVGSVTSGAALPAAA